jgi:putative pyruvate formate lyase activating enzyme
MATAGAKSGSWPAYMALVESGELERRVERAGELLKDCVLCGRQCHTDRAESVKGAGCRTGEEAVVSSFGPHHGEEAPLSGRAGSGTIFFGWCNLRCVYCQNWEISQAGEGRPLSAEGLARMMLTLGEYGCHNINFVSPSHVVAQILEAVLIAAREGLRLPLVYNTGGYDSPQALELLDGVIDIFMPDMKYGDSRTARQYSKVKNYRAVNRAAVKEMHRQVGDLELDERGIARRGLLVRHLVLPNGLAGSGAVLKFIAEEISPLTYVNLMAQYRPCHRAEEHAPLARRISPEEYRRAIALGRKYGLTRLETQ